MNKLDKSQMTPDQRMHYEMMMAKNASIIAMMKEEKEQMAKDVVEQAVKKKAIETAKNLKELGVKYEIISKSTGLSVEEIKEL